MRLASGTLMAVLTEDEKRTNWLEMLPAGNAIQVPDCTTGSTYRLGTSIAMPATLVIDRQSAAWYPAEAVTVSVQHRGFPERGSYERGFTRFDAATTTCRTHMRQIDHRNPVTQ